MSGPLFNGMADLRNEDLDQNLKYMINEEVKIVKGLFADEVFLTAEGTMALQYQVDRPISWYWYPITRYKVSLPSIQ